VNNLPIWYEPLYAVTATLTYLWLDRHNQGRDKGQAFGHVLFAAIIALPTPVSLVLVLAASRGGKDILWK
jgi:hypothetical protein